MCFGAFRIGLAAILHVRFFEFLLMDWVVVLLPIVRSMYPSVAVVCVFRMQESR